MGLQISIVTDEISADLETALELGVEWGVRHFELRGFDTTRVPNFSSYQKDRIRELLDEFGADIVAISPGLFKCPYPLGRREHFPLRVLDYDLHQRWQTERDLVKYHLEDLLPRSLDFAREIGAGIIVIFSFHRGRQWAGDFPDEVMTSLHTAAAQAEEAGLQLAIEVEDEFWADTGARTAELVRQLGHPALGVNWDPGNVLVAGETPFPDGYTAVQAQVRHVHFKDVEYNADGSYRYAIEGQIDWPGQIQALARDGYRGHISVETHMAPKVQSAKAMTERLRSLIQAAGGA